MAEILADLRVEAAALAQQKGYDIILTQTQAAVDVTDVTDDLIARIKR
jgi:Skp family chaperone for outer membrane proteins